MNKCSLYAGNKNGIPILVKYFLTFDGTYLDTPMPFKHWQNGSSPGLLDTGTPFVFYKQSNSCFVLTSLIHSAKHGKDSNQNLYSSLSIWVFAFKVSFMLHTGATLCTIEWVNGHTLMSRNNDPVVSSTRNASIYPIMTQPNPSVMN